MLAAELEQVTRLALQKLDQILRIPNDRGDGNLLRAQTAAAGIAVNTQLRADETRLRQKTQGDVLERLGKLIEQEKKLLPSSSLKVSLAPVQQTEHVELASEGSMEG